MRNLALFFVMSAVGFAGGIQDDLREGKELMRRGDRAGALAKFSGVIRQNPAAVEAYFYRARLFLEGGDAKGALADLNHVLKLRPDHTQALYFKVVAHHTMGELDQVINATTRALGQDLRNPFLYALRGNARGRTQQYAQALEDLNLATYLRNDFPMAFFDKGRVYRAMGDAERARRNFQYACGLNPQFCNREDLPSEKETHFLLSVPPKPEAMVCDCCEMYNRDGIHQEKMVMRTLADRKKKQLRTVSKFKVFKDFGFEDRYVESGIRFIHQIVDDAGKDWKPVHYDHGNGLAVADVDGDGRHDLYFTSQLGPNELWRNVGGGKFANITGKAGVGVPDRISVAATFADLDNDGDPDLYVTTVRMGNLLFENTGGGTFRDVTQASGLGYSGHSSGITVFDYDNDGLLDVFLANVGVYTHDRKGYGGYYIGMKDAFGGHLYPERFEKSILFENQGGLRFKEVGEEMGLADVSFSGDASFTDFNGDLFPDLYVLNMQGDDRYYENQAGKAFRDRSAEIFPNTPWGTMGIKFFDYDNDGLMDLYLTDMHSDMSIEIYPRKEKKKADMQWSDEFLQGGANNIFGNAFYRNRGQEGFVEVSDRVGVENYWPWGLSTGDLNADGFQDIFVASSMNYHFRYGINSVFLNNRGEAFLDSEFILGIEPRPISAKPWFTLDCAGSDREHRHCTGRTGRTVVWGAYGTRTSAIFDYDDDGDLDIITGEFNAEPLVLTSNLSEKTKVHYLKVRLRGKASNRDGLGATVTIEVGGKRYTRYHDGKSGYLSQSSLPLYFGLDQAGTVDGMEVLWPSGAKQNLDGPLSANRLVEIVEP